MIKRNFATIKYIFIQKIIFDVIVYVDGRVWLNKIVHSNAKEPLEHVDNYKDTHGVNTNQIIKNHLNLNDNSYSIIQTL